MLWDGIQGYTNSFKHYFANVTKMMKAACVCQRIHYQRI